MNEGYLEVCAGVLKKDGRFWCARRGKGHSMAGKWEFPGGKIEDGETGEDAIAREMKEELSVDVRAVRHIITATHRYPDFAIRLHVYLVEFAKESEPVMTEHEDGAFRTFEEIKSLEWDELDGQIIAELAKIV